MFKVFKYLFIANLCTRAKNSFLVLFGAVISLILISLIINDAVSVASGMNVYILLSIKWVSIIGLLTLIGYSILKIINIATSPFTAQSKSNTTNSEEVDNKKDRILNKAKLFTKSDSILQKYLKDL